MPAPSAKLPLAAVEHMSQTAKQNLPSPLQVQVADPGVYLPEGLYGAGPGWYHIGTSQDQVFLGHPNEADYFVFDFDVTSTGNFANQGFDVTTQFERALDGVVPLDTFATISPSEAYNVVAAGGGGHGKLDETIAYALVRLRFEGPMTVETEIGPIGSFGFIELV